VRVTSAVRNQTRTSVKKAGRPVAEIALVAIARPSRSHGQRASDSVRGLTCDTRRSTFAESSVARPYTPHPLEDWPRAFAQEPTWGGGGYLKLNGLFGSIVDIIPSLSLAQKSCPREARWRTATEDSSAKGLACPVRLLQQHILRIDFRHNYLNRRGREEASLSALGDLLLRFGPATEPKEHRV
jgi:hypothetical protein